MKKFIPLILISSLAFGGVYERGGKLVVSPTVIVPTGDINVDGGTGTAGKISFTAGSTTGQAATDGFEIGISGTGSVQLIQKEASSLNFYTNNAEAMRINSDKTMDALGAFTAPSVTTDSMLTDEVRLNGATGNSGTFGTLNVRSQSDSLCRQLQLEGVSGTNLWCLTGRDNGDFFFYNPTSGNVAQSFTNGGATTAFGPAGALWQLDVNKANSDTTPATLDVYPVIGITNYDATNNNYSGLAFADSSGTHDAAVIGVHKNHSTHTGDIEFWNKNAGTFARSMLIAANKSIKLDGYTTGVCHLDADGDLTSSAIVNADVDAAAAIVDTKLATIATAGKVSNSATTGVSAATGSTLVLRDPGGAASLGQLIVTNTSVGNTALFEDAASDTTPFVIDSSGNVGVGITSPGAGMALNVVSTTGVLAVPAMNSTQRNAITPSRSGGIIWNTDNIRFETYAGSWTTLINVPSGITGENISPARVTASDGVRLNTTAGRPTCASGIRGLTWVTQGGAGVADIVAICLKGTADTYAWLTIGTAP